MSLVSDEMLSRLSRMFGDPRTNDPDGYMDEFERALRGYSRDVLIQATNELIDNAARPFWPTVGEARAACRKAAERLAMLAKGPARSAQEQEWPSPSPEEAARMMALITEAGKKMASVKDPERALPDVSREAFEKFRESVISTVDGRRRHTKGGLK